MTPTKRTVRLSSGLPASALSEHPESRAPDLELRHDGDQRNLAFDLPRICETLGGSVPRRVQDLLEIAVCVYAADVAFLRGQHEEWVRATSFLIPVREPEFWRSVEPELARSLYILTKDAYVFEFCEREDGAPPPEPSASTEEHNCVCLLSGGLDSFAGATVLLATDRKPFFVAHRPRNPAVAVAQEHVHKCLKRRFGEAVSFVTVPCGPARETEGSLPFPPSEERETSQRARSFLYMALGAAACAATGARELVCPENGLLAVNPPLTQARVGGHSTGGTRPQCLTAFAELLLAADIDITVGNPFIYRTKGELLGDVLRPHFSAEEIQGAVSCWMAGRFHRPCGSCVPCLLRAVSMETAGLPPEAHMVEPLGTGGMSGPESAARANLVDMIAFTRTLRTLDDSELIRRWPMFLDLAPHADPVAAIAMLRRFALEASAAIDLPDVDV